MTTSEATKRDRAYVDKSQIESYRQLAGVGDSGKKSVNGDQISPFKSLKDVFLLSVCIGVRIGKRTPLKDRQEVVLTSYLNNHQDMAFLRAVAIVEQAEIEVVGNTNEVLTIAEEYANTGFEELRRRLNSAGIPVENLVELVLEQ